MLNYYLVIIINIFGKTVFTKCLVTLVIATIFIGEHMIDYRWDKEIIYTIFMLVNLKQGVKHIVIWILKVT